MIGTIIGLILFFVFVLPVIIGSIYDVFTVNEIMQESIEGDTDNASNKASEFAVKKTKETAEDIIWAPIVAIFLTILGSLLALIGIKI